jgi:hypothetical protein
MLRVYSAESLFVGKERLMYLGGLGRNLIRINETFLYSVSIRRERAIDVL